MVQYFNQHHKILAAMCSGTIVLSDAKVIEGKKVTGYEPPLSSRQVK